MTTPKTSLPQFSITENIPEPINEEFSHQYEDEPVYCYAIVDCAHFDACFYKMFIKNPNITSYPLLADTPYSKSSEAGPLLVKIEPDREENQDIINEILFAQEEKPSVLWFWSKLPFLVLKKYLKELLFAENQDGKKYFLRFYDPRCFIDMLEIFKADNNIDRYLKKIECWAYYLDSQYYYINKDS